MMFRRVVEGIAPKGRSYRSEFDAPGQARAACEGEQAMHADQNGMRPVRMSLNITQSPKKE
jgi:hypothetical protein